MSFPLPIADSGIEALVWLVVAVIWFIIRSAAKGTRRGIPTPTPRRPATNIEDGLKEFLKNIEGMGMETPPQTPPPPLEIVQPPEIQRQIGRREKKAKKTPRAKEILEPIPPPAIPDLSASEQVLQKSSKQRTVVMPHFTIPGLQVAKMGLSAVTVSAHKSQSGVSQAKQGFGNKRALRNAVFARVILGPPRAFE